MLKNIRINKDFDKVVDYVSKYYTVPRESVELIALSVLAGATQGKVSINVDGKSWIEPTIIWTLVVSGVSTNKTGVLKILSKPIYDSDAIIRGNISESIRDCEEKLDQTKTGKASIKHAYDKKIGKSKSKLRMIEDITHEALCRDLGNGGKLLASSEGEAFTNMTRTYNEKSSAQNSAYLKAYSKESIVVSRKGGEDIFIQEPALSIAMMCQPQRYFTALNNAELAGVGVLERFITYVNNDTSVPSIVFDIDDSEESIQLHKEMCDLWDRLVKKLMSIQTESYDGRLIDNTIKIEKGARSVLQEFQTNIENYMRTIPPKEHALHGKYRGKVVRISGLIALLEDSKIVTEEYMTRAGLLMNEYSEVPDVIDATYDYNHGKIIEFITNNDYSMKRDDLRMKCKNNKICKTAKELDLIIDEMFDLGLITITEVGYGRGKKTIYSIEQEAELDSLLETETTPAPTVTKDLIAADMSSPEFAKLPIWVNWREVSKGYDEDGKEKISKEPMNPNKPGSLAKTNDATTWTTYKEAKSKSDKIGFVLQDNMFAIDIDVHENTDEVMDLVNTLKSQLPTYTEISPSGKGFHIVGIADSLDVDTEEEYKAKYSNKAWKNKIPGLKEIEFYYGKYDKRYMTFTGNRYGEPNIITNMTNNLPEFLSKYMLRKSTVKNENVIKHNFNPTVTIYDAYNDLTNSDRGQQLIYGVSTDESAADQSLICYIIKKYQLCLEDVYELFMMTDRGKRAKVQNRADYVYRSIEKAFRHIA